MAWRLVLHARLFQRPQPGLLRELGRLTTEHSGNIYRLDIACDARIDPLMTAEEQSTCLKEHMLLIKLSAQRIGEIENVNGTKGYDRVPDAHAQGAPRDNLESRAGSCNTPPPRSLRFRPLEPNFQHSPWQSTSYLIGACPRCVRRAIFLLL